MSKLTKFLSVSAFTAVMTANANAALTAPVYATTDVETIAGAVLLGLAAIWAIKKALSIAK